MILSSVSPNFAVDLLTSHGSCNTISKSLFITHFYWIVILLSFDWISFYLPFSPGSFYYPAQEVMLSPSSPLLLSLHYSFYLKLKLSFLCFYWVHRSTDINIQIWPIWGSSKCLLVFHTRTFLLYNYHTSAWTWTVAQFALVAEKRLTEVETDCCRNNTSAVCHRWNSNTHTYTLQLHLQARTQLLANRFNARM